MANISNVLKTGGSFLQNVPGLQPVGAAFKMAGSLMTPKPQTTLPKPQMVNNLVPPKPATTPAAQKQTASAVSSFPVRGLVKPSPTPAMAAAPAPATTDAVQSPTQKPVSFPGLVGDIRTASAPTNTQTDLNAAIRDSAARNIPIGNEAQKIADNYGRLIAETGALGAGAVAGNLSTGTSVVGSGNAAIASQSASQRMAALADAEQAALAGIDRRLTAAGQEASALGTGVGAANTQQSQTLEGLGSAAGLIQPGFNYPFVTDPLGGTFNNQGGAGVFTPQQAAQALMDGSISWEQAKSSLAYLGGTGEAQLQSAVTAAGGNPLQLQAQGSATQSNIQQAETAQTDIARTGLQNTTQEYVAMTGAAQFAQGQSNAVIDILNAAGLNNVSSTDYNKALNNLKGRFGDTNYASLNTALQEAQFAYANLLSTGGSTPTANDERALATLNINQSASAIKASIRELDSAVNRRLQAKDFERQQYQKNLGSGGSNVIRTSVGEIDTNW